MQNDPNSSGSPDKKLRAIRKDTEAKIAALLTDEQKMKFSEWQQEREGVMERRQQEQENEPQPPPDPVGEALSATF